MQADELERGYETIRGRLHRGLFFNGVWDRIAAFEHAWEAWIEAEHPELAQFVFYPTGAARQEHALVEAGRFEAIAGFVASLPQETRTRVEAAMRALLADMESGAWDEEHGWRISEDELNELEDQDVLSGYLPWFEVAWGGDTALAEAYEAWARAAHPDEHAAWLQRWDEARRTRYPFGAVEDLERWVRRRDTTGPVLAFLEAIPRDLAIEAVAAIRAKLAEAGGLPPW